MLVITYFNHRINTLDTQAWRRPPDRRTSTQTAERLVSKEKAEVDALSASCIEDDEKEEVEALSASCIEDGEEDDMFAIATQEPGVVDETVDTTVEKVLENTIGDPGEIKVAEEGAYRPSHVPDSMGLIERETAPLNGDGEEEGMFFHNLEKQEAQEALCHKPSTPRQTTIASTSLTNDSALLDAETQALSGQPNESSLLFGEPTQVF